VGPVGPVDDGRGVLVLLPGATGNVRFNRQRGPLACLVARALVVVDDVRSNETGGMIPRRVLRLKLRHGGQRAPAIMACHLLGSRRGIRSPIPASEA
jgi:hypothetical protein